MTIRLLKAYFNEPPMPQQITIRSIVDEQEPLGEGCFCREPDFPNLDFFKALNKAVETCERKKIF